MNRIHLVYSFCTVKTKKKLIQSFLLIFVTDLQKSIIIFFFFRKNDKPRCVLKSRDITLQIKICTVKAMVFPVVMYGCESWTIKKAEHQRIDAFELWCWRSPLDSKAIRPVNPKGNQPWLFLGRTDPEALILWPPDVKSWLTGKDPNAENDWRQEEKGMTEDEMVGWQHGLNGHEFEPTPGDGEG